MIAFSAIALIGISSLVFISCNKNTNNEITLNENSRSNQTMAKFNNLNNLDIVKQDATEIHNEYLTNLLKAYTNNDIETINTLPNFNSQLVWSKSYFTNANIDMTNWNIIESLTTQKYDVSNFVFVANNDRYNSYASVAMKNYANVIMDAISKMSDINQTDMVAVCEGVYSNMKTDNNLDENNKLLLAVVIGVTEGSYLYWKGNVNNWPIITKPNNNTQYKWKQVAGFLAADAMGAMDGGAAGSVLPGVGTAAGAIMGGALYSGFVAWGW